MAAETGSGKTGAFCIPILQIVWETVKDIQDGKAKGGGNNSFGSTSKVTMYLLVSQIAYFPLTSCIAAAFIVIDLQYVVF